MGRRQEATSLAKRRPPESDRERSDAAEEKKRSSMGPITARRSGSTWLLFFGLMIYSSWAVYNYQYQNLPQPLTAEQAGKRGFSEVEAMKHVKALTEFGPHPVGSNALELAVQYVLAVAEKIKETAHWEVDVELDYFHVKSGANRLVSGLFTGKTLVYSDLNHVVLRIMPKYASEAEDNAILVSSHIDTVFSTGGAGDCSSCVAVMLELARGVSQWAHGFKNAVIFLFNTGEEEGLNGAHSFITQHPWSKTIRTAIDLEAMGVGGKAGIFQAGPDPWAIENFASAAKYPSGQVISQDLFSSGVIKSATDFQIYKEVAGLSGLDFAYTDSSAVYHTKNDKIELLKSGSLQHLGENMLAFLLQTASSSHLPQAKKLKGKENRGPDDAVFFDILGTYMVVYKQQFASMLHNSAILQSTLIWATSLFMGGYPAIISLGLSCLSAVLMWLCSIGLSVLVAFFLPQISSYLSKVYSRRKQLSFSIQANLVKLEAERWLFKAGFLQWFILLIAGNYYKVGSSYLALVWLAPPAFAYGLLEATLTPARLPKPLKLATLSIGLVLPILVSAGNVIRLADTIVAIVVRYDRNPGGTPEWMGNMLISIFIAATVCLTLVYILAYVHLSGAKRAVVIATILLFGLSLISVLSGIVPPFTEDSARAVNVVQVVDTTGSYGHNHDPSSYISVFSVTPGKLTKEIEHIDEGLICGTDKAVDFVTFTVKYGCWTSDGTNDAWEESEVPSLHVDHDTKGDERITQVSVDTKFSVQWALAINTEEIEDFILKGNSEELISMGNKTSVDGWHILQFSGGQGAPRKFELTLHWVKKPIQSDRNIVTELSNERPLLKLRTDVDRMTPKVKRILGKLPAWCSLFGKSTSPLTLSFLNSLPVHF
ncbi:hypothetical protein K2173_010010 [Erythroxylum novogranatense]|uniref:Vacuolar membrane protease n=1 Tax=Erythroxylum novogranatense TaxID=1862640 RepID=A0AAV8T0W0_9ROSI|nr:hypothetical protein K2173_010010 [Erythroxylum novogranatense]